MSISGHFFTTGEVARLLGVTDIRVRQFYANKRLKGIKVGSQILIERDSAKKFAAIERQPGRPKKSPKRR